MDIQRALAFADQVVFAKTGKHVDDLQAGVFVGSLQRQRYNEIAKVLQCTEGYAKDIGYELWSILSEYFGEEVNKSNLRATLLRKGILNSVSCYQDSSQDSTNSPEFLRGVDYAKSEAIHSLRKMGLSNQQIAQALNLSLDKIELLDP